jgi:glycosyltransferase involved in cell wall biosynthesis
MHLSRLPRFDGCRYCHGVKIRYVLNNAYAAGGTIRTVINQANALCTDYDVELASVYRHRDAPVFAIDPRVRLVQITDLHDEGYRWTDPPGGNTRLLRQTRRFRNPLPHGNDFRYSQWDPFVDAAIVRYFWASKDGVLVTTRPGLNLLSAWLGPRRLIRVAQDHMNFGTYKPRLRAAIIRAYPRLDAVTVLTEHDRTTYQEALAGSSVRLARIPNGIPPKDAPSAAHDAKRLVAAGRLTSQKGFDLLIKAFAIVHAKHPDWTLTIFGAGPWQKRLTDQRDSLGLTGTVHLPGVSRTLDRELAASSLFVLSSRAEGLPMVLLEAMSTGLPVVAFDCPTGPAEVIEHGITGMLVPPKDVTGLATALVELIEDSDRRRAMGAAAFESSRRYFMPSIRDSWERLFGEINAARSGLADGDALSRGAGDLHTVGRGKRRSTLT